MDIMDPYVKTIEAARQAWTANDFEKALRLYQQVIQADPTHSVANHSMALIMDIANKHELCLSHMSKAVQGDPDNAKYRYDYGTLLFKAKKYEQSIGQLKRSLELDPLNAHALNHLGAVYNTLGELALAERYLRKCVALSPDHYLGHTNLANVLTNQGKVEEALASYRGAMEIKPDYQSACSNYLFTMMYRDPYDATAVFAEHRKWAKRVEQSAKTKSTKHFEMRNTPRNIGYVSGDFRVHSCTFFLLPLLNNHDRTRFKIHCYSNVAAPDAYTDTIRERCDVWRDICGRSDTEALSMIQEDGIDILIDLGGHTADSRLSLFLLHAAPLQVTYLGYPNTTGLSAMDFRITDAEADPLDQDQYYTEKLYRLPHGFLCYRFVTDAPDVGPLPCSRNGFVTFGSFNNLPKVSPTTIRLWSTVLKAVPGSKLMIKTKYFKDHTVREHYEALFEAQGIDRSRLQLKDFAASTRDHLDLYNQVDIGLDTFPYNGTTTTCEALWMGVPVVSLCGKHHASRVGKSLLTRVGLPSMVAESEEKYVKLASHLCSDPQRLASLRASLRQTVVGSPLRDGLGFTRSVEDAYLDMWETNKAG